MPAPRPCRPSSAASQPARSALVERLAQPPRLEDCGPLGRDTVRAIRMLAAHSSRGSDPLPDLLRHLHGVDAVRCLIGFADAVGNAWPERVQVLRPCCGLASPDEVTLAAMVSAAAKGDRRDFGHQIAGFVSSAHHDVLFDLAVRLAASWRGSPG
ncbi:hypothetical protein [Altererythrobacter lauratis]|uniref:DUF2336 domain-containing protein n=1 Tax=Alteraurantiacibacter lauratis TaxID=2054627 RepID=A0ABV7EHJ4_9SPHN